MYTVKILPSEEFDKLPFSEAHRALGAADPKTNIAYVRDTGYNDITKHTIEHELDELMASTSPHEIDGIRYKIPILGPLFSALGTGAKFVGSAALKGGQALGNFLTPGAARFGPAAAGAAGAGAAGAGGAYQSIIGSQAAGPALGFQSSLPGFSDAGTIASGGLKAGAAGLTSNIFDTFGRSIASNIGSNVATGSPFVRSGDFPAAAPSPWQSLLGGAKNILSTFNSPIANIIPGQPGQQQQQPQSYGGQILDMFKGAAPGAAVSMLGNLFAKKVAPPDFSGVTDPLRSRIMGENGAGGPAFDLGFGEAKRTIDAPLGQVPEEVFGASEKIRNQQLADDVTQLRNQFKALNPTADVENNSAFLREKSRLEERAREDKANSRAATSFEFTNQELGRRLTTMQTLLNLDQAQTSQLIQLAQLDVAEIMARAEISLSEATQLKQLFGNFGQILMQNQFPGTQPIKTGV